MSITGGLGLVNGNRGLRLSIRQGSNLAEEVLERWGRGVNIEWRYSRPTEADRALGIRRLEFFPSVTGNLLKRTTAPGGYKYLALQYVLGKNLPWLPRARLAKLQMEWTGPRLMTVRFMTEPELARPQHRAAARVVMKQPITKTIPTPRQPAGSMATVEITLPNGFKRSMLCSVEDAEALPGLIGAK